MRTLAEDAYAKEKYGYAVSFSKIAARDLGQLAPAIHGTWSKEAKSEIVTYTRATKTLAAQYFKDNNEIYYEREVAEQALDIPEGKVMMKATQFVPPDLAHLDFSPVPKEKSAKSGGGFFSGLFGGGSKSDNKPTADNGNDMAEQVMATKGSSSGESEVKQLVDMGFTKEQAQAALQKTGGNQEQALDLLLAGVVQ